MAFNLKMPRTVEFEFAGQVGHFSYNYGTINDAWRKWNRANIKKDDWLYKALMKLLTGWDIELDEGVPWPLTFTNLKAYPDLAIAIWNALWLDVGEAKGAS